MSNNNDDANDEAKKITERRNPTTIHPSTTTATSSYIENERNEQLSLNNIPTDVSRETNDDDTNNNNDGEKRYDENNPQSSPLVVVGGGGATFEEMIDWRNPDVVPQPEFLPGIRIETIRDTDDYDGSDDDGGGRKNGILLSSSSCRETEVMRKWDDPNGVAPRPEIIPPTTRRADLANGNDDNPEECFSDDIVSKKECATPSAHGDDEDDRNSNNSNNIADQSPTPLPRPGAIRVGGDGTESTSTRTIDSESNESHMLPLGAIVVDDEIQNLTNERESERRRANELAQELSRYSQMPLIEGEVSEMNVLSNNQHWSRKGRKYLSKHYFTPIFVCLAAVIGIIVGVTIAIKSPSSVTNAPSTAPSITTTPTIHSTTFHPSMHPSLSRAPTFYPTTDPSNKPSTRPSLTTHPSHHPSRSPSSRPTLSAIPSQTPTTIPSFVDTNVIVQDYIQILKGGGSSNDNDLVTLNDRQRDYYQSAVVTYTSHFAQNDESKHVTTECLINRQTLSSDRLKIALSVTYTSNRINVTRRNYPEEFKTYMNSVQGKQRTLFNLQSVGVAVVDHSENDVVFEEDFFTFVPTTAPTHTRRGTEMPTTTMEDLAPTHHPTFIDYKIVSRNFTHAYEGVGLEELDADQIYYLQDMYSSYTRIFLSQTRDYQFIDTICLVTNQTHATTTLSQQQQQRHRSLLQPNTALFRIDNTTALSNNSASFFSSQSSQRRESNELPFKVLEVKFKMTYISSRVDVIETNYPLEFKNYVNSDEGKTRTLFNLQSVRINVEKIHDL